MSAPGKDRLAPIRWPSKRKRSETGSLWPSVVPEARGGRPAGAPRWKSHQNEERVQPSRDPGPLAELVLCLGLRRQRWQCSPRVDPATQRIGNVSQVLIAPAGAIASCCHTWLCAILTVAARLLGLQKPSWGRNIYGTPVVTSPNAPPERRPMLWRPLTPFGLAGRIGSHDGWRSRPQRVLTILTPMSPSSLLREAWYRRPSTARGFPNI